ncbi:unnamed protein product [Linum tenue]|uniref:VASt domain-containing protein n=1 Tax=Linum tenue TaxID=586396 RepID=A0AAV0QT34_9ROSI|nr:unnamed protein product [Linum tenue]
MAVSSAIVERIDLPQMDASPSRSPSDLASDSSSSSAAAETPDRNDLSNPSPNPSSRDGDAQSVSTLRSEEYRRLFRLPADEVLLQDFNCAYQENILLQGHMYIFVHYICFYSNIFGFETKKVIPFQEITSVKRAKTAGIFPTAIEIIAGSKKYFFASFLSRDEAFKIINDGWFQNGNDCKAVGEQQDSTSECNSQQSKIECNSLDNGTGKLESASSLKNGNELVLDDRRQDDACPSGSGPTSCNEDDTVPVTTQLEDNGSQDHVDQDAREVEKADSTSSDAHCMWSEENCDAPDISTLYTKVAETKFPIKVEEFFNLFFSDDSVSFTESFHERCGDKELKCSSWKVDDNFGHVRDVSFQHPIKIYFGARFGSCQEVQKFRVFRNGHLTVQTSQEVNDVPYGDYFRVEGLWDVVKDGQGSNEGCILQVYVGVAFSKKTVFKGKIVQSTLEECREAYGIWITMSHEYLKKKRLEKPEVEVRRAASSSVNPEEHSEILLNPTGASESSPSLSDHHITPQIADSSNANGRVDILVQHNLMSGPSITSFVRGYAARLSSFFKSQSQVSMILIVAFVVIFLMQVSIVVLLNRPQQAIVASPGEHRFVGSFSGELGHERSSETLGWLERRMHHLKDEMLMVEARMERLSQEYSWLRQQIEEYDAVPKRK